MEQNEKVNNVTISQKNVNFHDSEVFKKLRTDSDKSPTFQSFKKS